MLSLICMGLVVMGLIVGWFTAHYITFGAPILVVILIVEIVITLAFPAAYDTLRYFFFILLPNLAIAIGIAIGWFCKITYLLRKGE